MSATVISIAAWRLHRARGGGGPPPAPAMTLADRVEVERADGICRGDRVELPDGSRGSVARLEIGVDGGVTAYVLLGFRNRMIAAHKLQRLPQQANGVRPEA
jgi:hypothetical protein